MNENTKRLEASQVGDTPIFQIAIKIKISNVTLTCNEKINNKFLGGSYIKNSNRPTSLLLLLLMSGIKIGSGSGFTNDGVVYHVRVTRNVRNEALI